MILRKEVSMYNVFISQNLMSYFELDCLIHLGVIIPVNVFFSLTVKKEMHVVSTSRLISGWLISCHWRIWPVVDIQAQIIELFIVFKFFLLLPNPTRIICFRQKINDSMEKYPKCYINAAGKNKFVSRNNHTWELLLIFIQIFYMSFKKKLEQWYFYLKLLISLTYRQELSTFI